MPAIAVGAELSTPKYIVACPRCQQRWDALAVRADLYLHKPLEFTKLQEMLRAEHGEKQNCAF